MIEVFQQPDSFIWIVAVGAVGILAWWGLRLRTRAVRRFADLPLMRRLAPGLSTFRPALRAAICLAALAMIVLALGDPRWGTRYVEADRSGMDLMFVVDVSRSMDAADASPSRLERAKLFVEDAVDELAGDRVGLVDFAGDPVVKSPLTLNYDAFKTSLSELSSRSTTRGGSMLGDAIRVAADAFSEDPDAVGRAIIVLSDGEDMESFPIEAAAEAKERHGARVYTVGLGDSQDGARIPDVVNGQPTWLKYQGAEVWSRMDVDTLDAVARAGDGAFVPAGTSLVDLSEFLSDWVKLIDERDRGSITTQQLTPRFRWFLLIALALLVLDCLISDRRRTPHAEGLAR